MSIPVPPAPPTAEDAQSKEPVLKIGTITAATTAALAVALEFGFNVTDRQQAAILGAAVILVPLAQAAWTRRKVWSPAAVAKLLKRERAR
jgi:hypothetical protein